MKEHLKKLDETLQELMAAEKIQKYNFPKDIKDLKGFPYQSHSEMIEKVKGGEAILIQGFERSSTIFSLMATKSEKFLHNLGLFGPYIVVICLILYAVYSSAYWLLLGIVFPLVSAFFTSPQFPFKKLIPWLALVLAILFLFSDLFNLFVFFSSYWICHLSLYVSRNTYSRTLFQRAFALESAFIFLHTGGYIELLDKKYRHFENV